MLKKFLLFVLSLSFLLEITLTAIEYLKPEKAMAMFKLTGPADGKFFAFLTSYLLLLVSALILLAIFLLLKRIAGYAALIYVLGIWWVGIGIGIYAISGNSLNLFTDSLKGGLLILLTYF